MALATGTKNAEIAEKNLAVYILQDTVMRLGLKHHQDGRSPRKNGIIAQNQGVIAIYLKCVQNRIAIVDAPKCA